MLQSLRTASSGLDVETVVVVDDASHGLSWARNQGLERASGEVVFFVDADDTVRPDYFRHHLRLLENSGADFVLSSFARAPLKRDYNLVGNPAIRAAMLPAFFGYSLADVRRWNRGGDLRTHRELGGVWRAAYRREFLVRNGIRFDERLRLFEDAPFLAECAARAERTASTDAILYDYEPGENGILATTLGTDRYYAYKFEALSNRKAIAARVGGNVMEYFEGSAVFSALELFRAWKGGRRYAADSFVADALRRFPLSQRHPFVAAAVLALRTIT